MGVCPDGDWEEKISFTNRFSPLGSLEGLRLLVVAYTCKTSCCRCIAWYGFLIMLMGGFIGEIANILLLGRGRDVGTKKGMKIGFVGGFFQLIFLLREDPTEETTNILSVSEGKSPRRRSGEDYNC